MASLRAIAQNCLGLTGSFSMLRDVYGYPFGNPGRRMSIKEQVRLLQGTTVDFNLIRVGLGNFSTPDNREIQVAVQVTRELYAQSNLGIRRLVWAGISTTAAGGFVTITTQAEAVDLTDAFNGPDGGAIDVFIVETFAANCDSMGRCVVGLSAVEGPCDKDDKDEMTGAVTSIARTNRFNSGVLMAHEVGHYLGLPHTNATNNMMRPTIAAANTQLTAAQGQNLRDHCFADDVC